LTAELLNDVTPTPLLSLPTAELLETTTTTGPSSYYLVHTYYRHQYNSALMRVCQKEGKSRLTSNGAHGKDQMVLCCSHFRFYTGNKNVKKAEGDYRNHSLNCDKKHARKDGKNQRRKTSTSRPVKGSEATTCKVKLVIGIDQYSLFLVCGIGEETHEGHPPLEEEEMPTRLRTVPQEASTMARLMANNSVRPGSIAGVLEDSHGVKLTRRQVARTVLPDGCGDRVNVQTCEAAPVWMAYCGQRVGSDGRLFSRPQ
jgi:hypothetical protein